MGTEEQYTPKSWITSDLHFSHKNIIKFCPRTRKFSDVDEMDRSLINEFQSKVHPLDTLYILGDVSFGNATKTYAILSQIPGKKILVYGNHDQVIRENPSIQRMFESVHEYLEVTVDGTMICMFHYPIAEFNKMHRGAVHFHGHLHGNPSGLEKYRVLDVSWDASGGSILELNRAITRAVKGEVKSHH